MKYAASAYSTIGTVGISIITKNRNISFNILPITDVTNPNVLEMGDASTDGVLGISGIAFISIPPTWNI